MRPSLPTFYAGLESEQVLERADAIRELQQHPGWAVLTEALEIHRDQLVENMTRGAVKSHEEYARRAGFLGGLDAGVETADKILEIAQRLREQLAGGAGEEATGDE